MKKYEPDTRDLLEEELKKVGFGGCEICIFEYPREAEDIDKLITSRFGITKDGDKPLVEFYTSIIDQIYEDQKSFVDAKYSGKHKYIQAIVRHELRHYQQYQYIVKNGLDLDLLQYEDALEKDANDFEKGIVNDLSKII